MIIETSENCYNKLKQSAELKKLKIDVQQIGKFNPRITIYNVPSGIEKDQLAKEIIQQNHLDEDITEERPLEIKTIYKFGPRDRHYVHWVVETNAYTRNLLLQKKTIYLDWHSCNVEDKIYITKCFNCQGYGHTAPKCNQKSACAHCAGEHDSRQCKDKEKSEMQKCILCMRAGMDDIKHRPRDGKCMAYKRRMETFVANIDFGEDNA